MQMTIKHSYVQLFEQYQNRFGLSPKEIQPNGKPASTGSFTALDQCDLLIKTRADAIREAVRWGEAYIFYLAPGILSWMIPVVDGDEILGGLIGGEVQDEKRAAPQTQSVKYLIEAGCPEDMAHEYLETLPHWSHDQIREAATCLFEELYHQSSLNARILTEHREHALQQRQIAENIHRLKDGDTSGYSFDQDRALFSLIRTGDKPGARKMLNKMLAGMFLNSPRVVMVQAYAIEMMGYLVRVAIADNPMLELMLDHHTTWIDRILKADQFETLCWEVREILDEFMDLIFVQGYNRSNHMAQKIMDYLAREYRNKLTLDQIGKAVGLSPFRVAHIVKDTTGKSVTQHIRLLRIREAQKLLIHTDKSYTDIAYDLGFADHSYFIKQFRETTGTTPAKYRRGY